MAVNEVYMESNLEEIIDWEITINRLYQKLGYIRVRNDVDDDGPPSDFKMINDYVSSCVELTEEPVIGCECDDCSSASPTCCPSLADPDRKCPNYIDGRLNVRPGLPIFECNMRCSCGADCPNRVVQKGVEIKFEIFKTEDGRGWGLRTLEPISKGQFVIEYLGEVITNDEAVRRETKYEEEGCTYMFDLDFDSGGDTASTYVVDATGFGNPSRFINHSCSPNLEVYAVYINLVDGRFPRLALFASRSIKENEELTFDYKMNCGKRGGGKRGQRVSGGKKNSKKIRCLCGARKCRKFLN